MSRQDHPASVRRRAPEPGLTASERIAEHVCSVDASAVPPAVIHQVGRAFLDTYAGCVAASGDPLAEVLDRYLAGRIPPVDQGIGARVVGGPRHQSLDQHPATRWRRGSATLWNGGAATDAETAAFANGAMSHALDYDDVTSPMRGHPSVAMLPALTALAETVDADGRRLSAAYQTGFEVICAISRAVVIEHYRRGWHATATIGLIGATAAACQLLGLTRDQVISALGIAVAQAAGTRQNFGSMAKSLQVGACGAAAVRSARLAQAGLTSSPHALDGDDGGFVGLYCDPDQAADLSSQLDGLGAGTPELLSSGIDVKKYPLCYATHRVIDTLLDLRDEHHLELDHVERVRIRANRGAFTPLLQHRPRTGLEAKFSLEYAVAAALHDGFVRLSSFQDAAVTRPEIQEFFPRVHALDSDGAAFPRWVEVAVRLRDGRTLQRRTETLRGSAASPLTDAQLIAKAADCFSHGGVAGSPEDFAAAVFSWADQPIRQVLAQQPAPIRKPGAAVRAAEEITATEVNGA
ncbi:MAG: MmgE/PrpD family protein [Micromonosporaceae bacterium]